MKAYFKISMILFLVVIACQSGETTKGQKITFGIHEVLKADELPAGVLDSLKSSGVILEKNVNIATIGYIPETKINNFKTGIKNESFELAFTYATVDKEQKYNGIAAVKSVPVITIKDIQKTKCVGDNVEIYFNLDGAHKWAELTKKSVGRSVAFILDGRIYTMPLVMAEIKSGEALIYGLNSKELAKRISESLNTSIK